MPDGKPLFDTGAVYATPGVLRLLGNNLQAAHDFTLACLARHAYGDWGDVNIADKARNDASVNDGTRIVSAYPFIDDAGTEHRIWCITEADRSATTLLLPEDY